jgi:hypothetical protein
MVHVASVTGPGKGAAMPKLHNGVVAAVILVLLNGCGSENAARNKRHGASCRVSGLVTRRWFS